MALSARVPHTPLRRLFALLAFTVVVDLVIASAVLVDRLDDPDIPDFNRLGVAEVRWQVSPYRDPSPLLGFPSRLIRPDRSGPPERQALYAIAAVARYDRTQDRRWLRQARAAVGRVLKDTSGGLVMHRTPTITLLGDPVEIPWYSAQTQGMLLSALAGLEAATGNRRLRTTADEVFAALRSFQGFFAGSQPAPEHWLSSVDSSGYLWFDQFSTGLSSSSVLTEQLWTALGIFDYQRVLADRSKERSLARELFAGSLSTVEHYLPQWRVQGQISISSLLAGNRDVRGHFEAKAQLRILAEITGGGWAERAAGQFDQDDNVPFFPVKPVSSSAVLDAYDPLPRDLITLARTGRPQRLTPSENRPRVSQADDPLRRCAEALMLLADPTDPDAVRRAADLVAQVMSTARSGAVPHRAPIKDVSGARVKGPWFSSATQGLLLSALTRLYERTGQPRWRRDADEVFAALTRVRDYGQPTTRPWLGLIDFSGNLYFDQNFGASTPPRSIYEHMTALVGIYDYWRMTQDGEAFAYFAGGVTTLRDAFPLIRKRERPAVESIASGMSDPGFHGLIAAETDALAAITQDNRLIRFARLLREDYP